MRSGIQFKTATQVRHKRGEETISDRRRDYSIGSHSEDDINLKRNITRILSIQSDISGT